MADSSLPLKEILVAAAPAIKSIVDVYVTPNLEKFKSRFSADYQKHHVPLERHFQEYFNRAYKKLCIVNTLVFNNSQRLLSDIFIPLTIELRKDNDLKGNKKIEYTINQFPTSLLTKFEKVLITDTAGMGKSTLMKRMFIQAIEERIGIPIFIELRRLNKGNDVVQEILSQISPLESTFDKNLFLELVREGGFVFMLDGYDEIPLEDRDYVTSDVQQFIEKAGGNKFILTSRPESALSSFGDFQKFIIKPLIKKEAFELLRKYDGQGQISRLLIKKLDENDMNNIDEFLTNPLLVSLLFTAFEHKQSIPFKKHLFYRQVYDANFENHDLTKGDSYIHKKYSNLEIDDFHTILRHIGFNCLKKQKIEYTKDELLILIGESKSFSSHIIFTESDFLKDIISTVPLFTQDGNYYRWSHKSIQEYFAAQFIHLDSKDQQKKILIMIYSSISLEKYINVIDLYYDIDTKGFRNIILCQLLEEYKIFIQNTYKDIPASLTQEDIDQRHECYFLKRIIYTTEDFDRINELERSFNFDNYFIVHLSTSRLIVDQSPKLALINLLNTKKCSFVKSQELSQSPDINFEIDTEYVCVDEKAPEEFNSPEIFKYLSTITLIQDEMVLDKKMSLTELEKIKSELKKENDTNYLLDGLL